MHQRSLPDKMSFEGYYLKVPTTYRRRAREDDEVLPERPELSREDDDGAVYPLLLEDEPAEYPLRLTDNPEEELRRLCVLGVR